MVTRRFAFITCGAAVLGLAIATAGDASSLAVRTNHLTFSGPVALPGVTLPRGTYTFEVIDLHSNIVRVLSRDRSQLYFTGFTRPVTRPATLSADGVVTVAEARQGVAPRVQVWYPIGDPLGRQFIYPNLTR